MSAKRISILGAAGTGKTTLARELTAHLGSRGLAAVAVPEALRDWCERAGRAPRPEEQLAIAQEQEARVDVAAGRADLVIADTTALMVAIHAGMPSPHGELRRFAIARQQAYDATLLMGLDLAWTPDGLHRDPAQSREEVDALLRGLLQEAKAPYQVVYGQGPQRLQSALRSLACAGVLPGGVVERTEQDEAGAAWVWVCEKCSDPACEHRLFSRLKSARA